MQRTVTRGAYGEAIIAKPKAAKSRRTVPMLAGLRVELLAHLERLRSVNCDEAGYVFTNTSMHGDQAVTADWMARREIAPSQVSTTRAVVAN